MRSDEDNFSLLNSYFIEAGVSSQNKLMGDSHILARSYFTFNSKQDYNRSVILILKKIR